MCLLFYIQNSTTLFVSEEYTQYTVPAYMHGSMHGHALQMKLHWTFPEKHLFEALLILLRSLFCMS